MSKLLTSGSVGGPVGQPPALPGAFRFSPSARFHVVLNEESRFISDAVD
jgi:hypothetical protein